MSTCGNPRSAAVLIKDHETNSEADEPAEKSWARVAWEIVKHPIRAGFADLGVSLLGLKIGISTGDRAIMGMSGFLGSFGAYKLQRFIYMQRHPPPYPARYGFG